MRVPPNTDVTRAGRRVLMAVVCACTLALSAADARAQTSSDQTQYRSRAFLDSVATQMERAGKTSEAASVRERLRVGDFYPGDKIVVELFGGEEPFRDTVSVRVGQEILVAMLPAMSLKGVLRSEADSAITVQARRYFQRPIVRTQPLVRFLVTGAVGRPDFVTVRGDAAVADVFRSAGGLTQASRLSKSKVKRGQDILLDADSLGVVLRTGMTVDQADLRPGDEFAIDEKKPSNLTTLLFSVSAVMGVVLGVIQLSRIR